MECAAIVNFCSNDARFLAPCIEQLKKAVSTIIFVVADHFFDQTKEDLDLLYQLFSEKEDVHTIFYPLSSCLLPKTSPKDEKHLWASISRTIGFGFLPKNTTHAFFLDVDEIPDGERLREEIEEKRLLSYDFAELGCYWYFRETKYQATTWEATPLFAKKSHLAKKQILHKDERLGTFREGKGKKYSPFLGKDEKPLFHHYSWVRSKEEMEKKVVRWGHAQDRDWLPLVTQEFAHPFQGKDFVHGYSFTEIPPLVTLKEPILGPLNKDLPTHLSKKEAYALLYYPYFFYPKSLKEKISLAENHFSKRS